jgi:hypothetical protein
MLLNRIQSTSAIFNTIQYGFATKNLKQIKIRMKAVESIKKITKVNKYFILGNEDGGSIQNETRCWKT